MNPSQKTNGRVSDENVCHVLSGVFPIELSSFVKGVFVCSPCFMFGFMSPHKSSKLLRKVDVAYGGESYEKNLL